MNKPHILLNLEIPEEQDKRPTKIVEEESWLYDVIDKVEINGLVKKTRSDELILSPGKHKVKLILNESPIKFHNAFRNCENMVAVRFENIDTTKNPDFSDMFFGCINLRKIEGCEDWNTRYVKDMSNMFNRCFSLESIEFVNDWDTTNLEDISGMLCSCSSLTSLKPLRNWKTDNIEETRYMLSGCDSIKSAEGLEGWNLTDQHYIYVQQTFNGAEHILEDLRTRLEAQAKKKTRHNTIQQ